MQAFSLYGTLMYLVRRFCPLFAGAVTSTGSRSSDLNRQQQAVWRCSRFGVKRQRRRCSGIDIDNIDERNKVSGFGLPAVSESQVRWSQGGPRGEEKARRWFNSKRNVHAVVRTFRASLWREYDFSCSRVIVWNEDSTVVSDIVYLVVFILLTFVCGSGCHQDVTRWPYTSFETTTCVGICRSSACGCLCRRSSY